MGGKDVGLVAAAKLAGEYIIFKNRPFEFIEKHCYMLLLYVALGSTKENDGWQ
jgi:hypothetical protein